MAAMTEALHAPAERPDEDVGNDAALEQRLQHAHLADRLVAAAGEHERGAQRARRTRRRSWLIEVLTGVGSFLGSCTPILALGSVARPRARFVWRGKAGAMLRPKSTPHDHTPHSGEGAGGPRVSEFYRNYLAVAVFIGAALLMVGAMLGVGRLMRPTRPRPEKLMPYEAGSDPVLGFGQSNVRYYVYALLFVMFDVEAVFIFPWAVSLESLGTFGLIEMIVFIVILALGLVYAWRKGVLRWA